MIDFIETHVEFILEFLHVLFPLDGESLWPRNSQTSYIPGGGVCFRLGSERQERIKFSVRVLSLGGIDNAGRCPSTVIVLMTDFVCLYTYEF
jgi:hypothetical protein